MTVAELIEKLRELPPDAEVYLEGEDWALVAPLAHVEPIELRTGWEVHLMI